MQTRAVLLTTVLVIGAALAGLFFGGRTYEPKRVAQGPSVGFDPDIEELGEQLWGQVLDIPLLFVNESEIPIEVHAIKSSCGCTIIDTDAYLGTVVRPGESLQIDARLDTETNPGEKTRQVFLDDTTGRRYTATIRVDVRGTWELSANEIEFGNVALDEGELLPVDRAIEFVSDDDALQGEPIVRESWLECLVSERKESPRRILFRLHPDRLTPGRHSTQVVIRTDNPIKPNTSVLVRVAGTQQLTASPQHVFLVADAPSGVTFYNSSHKAERLNHRARTRGAL